MRKNLVLGLALIAAAAPASAGVVQAFETDPILAPTQTPGAWYTDRYAPSGFESVFFDGGNRLEHSIDSTNVHASTYYNTEGRKYDVAFGTTYMSIDLWIPELSDSFGSRYAGFWGTAINGSNVVSGYPIIEYRRQGEVAAPTGAFGFSAYNPLTGIWDDLGVVTTNNWYTLELELVGDDVHFTVGGFTTVVANVNSSTSFTNAILQGYNASPGFNWDRNNPNKNTGASYQIYWDNLVTEAAVVPIPAAAPLGLLGMGLIAFMRRRKKQA